MIQPFNNLETLYAFTSYREGAGGSDNVGDSLQQAVLDGTFSHSQLAGFLQRARNEIYSRCGQKTNDEYSQARRFQLSEAELYLTVARMYLVHAERTALKFPESNLAGVAEVTIGEFCADVKSVKIGEPCDGNTELTNLITQGRLAA